MINTFPIDDIKNLDVKATAVKVSLHAVSGSEIRVESNNLEESAYRCELHHDTLIVSYTLSSNRLIVLPRHTEAKIDIFLPESLTLENVSLDLGAGQMEAERLSVSEKFDIDVGAGQIRLHQTSAGSLKLRCGAGECFYSGKIDNNFQVNCGVGNCKLRLTNKEQEFDYDISCALGEVSVNRNKLRGIDNRHRSQETTGKKAILQCSLGRISLETA